MLTCSTSKDLTYGYAMSFTERKFVSGQDFVEIQSLGPLSGSLLVSAVRLGSFGYGGRSRGRESCFLGALCDRVVGTTVAGCSNCASAFSPPSSRRKAGAVTPLGGVEAGVRGACQLVAVVPCFVVDSIFTVFALLGLCNGQTGRRCGLNQWTPVLDQY